MLKNNTSFERENAMEKRKLKLLGLIIGTAICISAITPLLLKHQANTYASATTAYNNGKYSEAAEMFDKLLFYKDARIQADKSHYYAGLDLIGSDISAACKHFHKAGDYEDASLNYEMLKLCIKTQNWDDGKVHSLGNIKNLSKYSNCVAYQVFSNTNLGKQLVPLQGEWITTETWCNGEKEDNPNPNEYRISGGTWRRTKGMPEIPGDLSYVDGTIYMDYHIPKHYDSIMITEDDSVKEIHKSSFEMDESETTLLYEIKWERK